MKLFRKFLTFLMFVLIIAFLFWLSSHSEMPLLEAVQSGLIFLVELALGIIGFFIVAALGVLIYRYFRRRAQDKALVRAGDAHAKIWQRDVPYPPYPKHWWDFLIFWKH